MDLKHANDEKPHKQGQDMKNKLAQKECKSHCDQHSSLCEPDASKDKTERRVIGEDGAEVNLGADGGKDLSENPPRDHGKSNSGKQNKAPLASSLKKPRTAYFIFMGEKRPQVTTDYPSESVGSTARRIGQLWAALTPQQKEKYKIQATDERKRYNEAMSKLDSVPSGKANSLKRPIDDEAAIILPLARIRKICRLDPEVRNISKEALLLITKAAEHFTQKLGKETAAMARMQKNRKTLLPGDILDVCSLKAPFYFLKDDIQDIIKDQSVEKKNKKLIAPKETKKLIDSSGTGIKPLTSYFKLR